MIVNAPRIVLVDILRNDDAIGPATPARVPCHISSEELANACAYAGGTNPACSVVLAFREAEMLDYGVNSISPNDTVLGLYDTSGAMLATMPLGAALVAVDTVRLSRPGRHLLCVHFRSGAAAAGSIREEALPAAV